MIQVDLHAPTVARDQRVWRLFPGIGYQFLPHFLEQHVGFLDFPDLSLPPELSGADDLIARVARSQDVRDAFYKYGPDFKPATIKLPDYARARHTQKRGRLRQAIINMRIPAIADRDSN